MTTTELIFELLKYLLPAGLVLAAVALVLRENRNRQEQKDKNKILGNAFEQMIPLRLQAYERVILFLERISPENLIIRCDGTGKSARGFLTQMTMEIRAEYEHNIAQQLYIRQGTWKEVVRAKEEILTIINQTSHNLAPDASGIDLGRGILNYMMNIESAPAHDAIKVLKNDVQQMFSY